MKRGFSGSLLLIIGHFLQKVGGGLKPPKPPCSVVPAISSQYTLASSYCLSKFYDVKLYVTE